MNAKAINWNDVDFAGAPDAEIAMRLGVSRMAVYLQRKKRGIEKKPPPDIDWAAQDWRFSDRYLAKLLGRSMAEVKRHRPADF